MTTYTKSFRTWDEAHAFAEGLEAASHGDVHNVWCAIEADSSEVRWTDECSYMRPSSSAVVVDVRRELVRVKAERDSLRTALYEMAAKLVAEITGEVTEDERKVTAELSQDRHL